MRIDHAVVLVRELAPAMDDFKAAGFNVTPGGLHLDGATHNALIGFADTSYIELLAFTSGLLRRALPALGALRLGGLVTAARNPLEQRVRRRALRGGGLIDFALRPDSLEAKLARWRREGVPVEGPLRGGRTGQNGEEVAWEVGVPAARELPFLISDVTDRALRIPTGEATRHANGTVGIAGITVAVESLEASSARYGALLGLAPEPASRERMANARGRTFTVEDAEVVLATAAAGSHPLHRQLQARGEGPFALEMRVSTQVERPLRTTLLHGARLNVVRVESSRL